MESVLEFANFVAFFPQLVAGPIERARGLLPQFAEERPITARRVERTKTSLTSPKRRGSGRRGKRRSRRRGI